MVNIEGLKFICVGTINSATISGAINVSESVKDLLTNPDNWELKDTYESLITQEVKLLMENTFMFFQIEFTVVDVNKISKINIVQDKYKRIKYNSEDISNNI